MGRFSRVVAVGVLGLAWEACGKSVRSAADMPEESARVSWHSRWLCPVSQCSLFSVSMCASVLNPRASKTASAAGRAANTTNWSSARARTPNRRGSRDRGVIGFTDTPPTVHSRMMPQAALDGRGCQDSRERLTATLGGPRIPGPPAVAGESGEGWTQREQMR